MTIYEVTGRTAYNCHAPGETFEASLFPAVEARALARGSIAVLEHSTPSLASGSFALPTTLIDPDNEGNP